MPIDCAEFCKKCGLFHLASFDCGAPEVEEDVKVEEPAAAPVDETPAAPEAPVAEDAEDDADKADDTSVVKEAAEAVEAVADAVADGVVTAEEKGHVLDEVDDVKPAKKQGRKKAAE